jgi:formylglycine-generating enzyme required for sulfatase activity
VEVRGGNDRFRIDRKTITVTRGGRCRVRITRRPDASGAPPPAVAPLDAAAAKQHQQAWAEYLGLPVECENSAGMTLRLVPPGEFDMGLTAEQIERLLEQGRSLGLHDWFLEQLPMAAPRRRVRITRPFYMAEAEVTQGQFLEVTGANPSHQSPAGEGAAKAGGRDTRWFPVERVTWDEAAGFCRRLSGRPEERSAGRTYRLPSEAQWEYACRAGTVTLFSCGDGLDGLARHAWFGVNSGLQTHPVREKSPNAWGLHDVHGNVYEWCGDWFHHRYDAADPATDPAGPESGTYRVQRGGGMKDHGWMCISAFRNRAPPEVRFPNTGFRVVCEISEATEKH